jgi:hypothetical protein
MKLRYEPLLQVQRDLYQMPRGCDRFRDYLRLMLAPDGDDLSLPWIGINPTGQDPLPAVLDALLALDADAVAAAAAAEAQAALVAEPGSYAVALVVGDDASGGSPAAGRYAAEMAVRFRQKHFYTRGWIVPTLWTSETSSTARV